VSTIVVALIAVAALLAAPGRPGRSPQAARLAFRQLTSVWFNSPSAALAYGGRWLFAVLTDPARLVRLDPAGLTVTGALPLGSPGFDLDPVAYGDGAVWVCRLSWHAAVAHRPRHDAHHQPAAHRRGMLPQWLTAMARCG